MNALDKKRFDAAYITVERLRWTAPALMAHPCPRSRRLTADRGQGPNASLRPHRDPRTPGEDGKLQGTWRCSAPSPNGRSAQHGPTMSKFQHHRLLRQMGFSVSPSIIVHRDDPESADRVLRKVGVPSL